MQKPSIPKGTRDFGPEIMYKRNYLINCLQTAFKRFGFAPIETPSMENLSTLMGKYGEEGDRLIFKILNSGDYLSEINKKKPNPSEWNSQNMLPFITEKALRYDLTVPFARFVVQNQNDLIFPFKRYQIQPVWRADRPQKGRFREFYQCDADVVGSTSLYQEVELLQLYDFVFSQLNLPVTIHLNNRKILAGLAEVAGIEEQLIDFTVALDKLDKIGEEAVKNEMITKGISAESLDKVAILFNLGKDFTKDCEILKSIMHNSVIGMKGIEEIEFVYNHLQQLGLKKSTIQFNVTLARGLNYYTGCIFEISAQGVEMGSIGGGGRYDNLTAVFGLNNISGVGISFGLDRIYLVLEALNLFPTQQEDATQIIFMNLGKKEAFQSLQYIQILRDNGINSELFPDATKLNKQLTYANKRNIPFVAIIGEEELKNNQIVVKNMLQGTQETVSIESILQTNYFQ